MCTECSNSCIICTCPCSSDMMGLKGICMVCDDPHPGRRAKDVKIAM